MNKTGKIVLASGLSLLAIITGILIFKPKKEVPESEGGGTGTPSGGLPEGGTSGAASGLPDEAFPLKKGSKGMNTYKYQVFLKVRLKKMLGDNLSLIQREAVKLAYDNLGKPDGIFGKMTEAASLLVIRKAVVTKQDFEDNGVNKTYIQNKDKL